MVKITFEQKVYQVNKDETILDTMLRMGVNHPFSCRGGLCHLCIMRTDDQSAIPDKAHQDLNHTLIKKGYFLPCICKPTTDLVIKSPRKADLLGRVTVHSKELLTDNILRLLLIPATPLYYHAGQYMNLWRADGLARSYSLASVPSQDEFLEFHIKRQPKGKLSNWLFDKLPLGTQLEIQGPQGECYYHQQKHQHKKLLLIGTGTGLAPLMGLLRDALSSGHQKDIYLYHSTLKQADLYQHEKLTSLVKKHPHFHYMACSQEVTNEKDIDNRHIIEIISDLDVDLEQYTVFLCGTPDIVNTLNQNLIQAGANKADIYLDAFTSSSKKENITKTPYPEIIPEIWEALKDGVLLKEILHDFYTQVYADKKLAPFFEGVEKDHVIGKQYSFLYKVFTGQDVYFGEDMRNAHHWMVISDELFDYRENLLETVIRAHNFPEHLIAPWRKTSEHYRANIVKSEPFNRVIDGVELETEKFEELVLDSGGICDNCQGEVQPGETIRYHVRMGKIFCQDCGF